MSNWNLGTALRLGPMVGSMGVSGNLQYLNPLTNATLSGPATVTIGNPATFAVTLNLPANQTYIVTPTCPGATVFPATFNINAGSAVGTFTVTPFVLGTFTVDFTISPVLTLFGRPFTLTCPDVTWSSAPTTPLLYQQGAGTQTYSLAQNVSFYNPVFHQFVVTPTGVQLPAAVTLTASTGLLTTSTTSAFSVANVTYDIANVSGGALADFNARASGAYFSENFSSYATLTAWYNFWNRGALVGVWTPKNPTMGTVWTDAWELITDPTHVKSGKALRAYMGKHPTPSGGPLDNQYAIFPLSGNPLDIAGSYHLKYYFQAVVWADDYINYYWAIPGGGSRGAKFFVNETWYSQSFGDPAECVIDSNMTYPGFITGYHTDGAAGHQLSRTWERGQAIPSNSSSFAGQGGIDNGTALDGTDASYFRRYGPMYQMPPTPNQGSLMSTQGVPNTNAAIGGVAWNRGSFTVIEIECDAVAHRCRVWAAPYGSAPKLVHDSGIGNAFNVSLNDAGRTNPPASAGTGNGFSGVGLSNLVYTADEASNPGRPAAPYVDYVEIIAHPNPINFPGGFVVPGIITTLAPVNIAPIGFVFATSYSVGGTAFLDYGLLAGTTSTDYWSNIPTSFAVTVFRNGVFVSGGGTNVTQYAFVSLDQGKIMTFQVVASNAGGPSLTTYSAGILVS